MDFAASLCGDGGMNDVCIFALALRRPRGGRETPGAHVRGLDVMRDAGARSKNLSIDPTSGERSLQGEPRSLTLIPGGSGFLAPDSLSFMGVTSLDWPACHARQRAFFNPVKTPACRSGRETASVG